jgi:methyl-accepting chemotaxis protein
MWKSRSIAKKIYISIGIIVLGYSASMLCVVVEGARAQTRLTAISSSLFPAAQQCQAAVTAYDLQTKAYEDAVTVGDKKLLQVAKENGEAAAAALESVGKLPGLGAVGLEDVRGLADKLKSYSTSAEALYTEMASGKMAQIEKAGGLAKQSQELKDGLRKTAKEFSLGLQAEIATIKDAAQRDQIINGLGFVVVVVVSLLMIVLVVGSTIRRIKKTVEKLHDISNGQWDLTARLECDQQDELGELALCINLFV